MSIDSRVLSQMEDMFEEFLEQGLSEEQAEKRVMEWHDSFGD